MIDIHMHILPGLDDGPQDMERSIEMCRIAADDGIDTVVASPHNLYANYRNGREKVLSVLAELHERIRQDGLDVTILPGSEVYLSSDLLRHLEGDGLMTINDNRRFLLMDLPSFFKADHVSRLIFSLKMKGITPIISHPERNAVIADDINMMCEIIRMGALSQLSAGSLTGRFGRSVRKTAIAMLHHNMVHMIATDAHNITSRPPVLSRAVEAASREIGTERAMEMVRDVPHKIISGELPPTEEPERQRKGFFSIFLRNRHP
jgi:protein-tyrosine phosphatase